jgi:hypothetical protein
MMVSNVRLLHVLQAAAAWKKATDEEKDPHVAAAEREKQVYQKLSADYQASKEAAAAAEAEAAAPDSLAPPQVSWFYCNACPLLTVEDSIKCAYSGSLFTGKSVLFFLQRKSCDTRTAMPRIQRLGPLAPANFPGMLYACRTCLVLLQHTLHVHLLLAESLWLVAKLNAIAKHVCVQLKLQKVLEMTELGHGGLKVSLIWVSSDYAASSNKAYLHEALVCYTASSAAVADLVLSSQT